MPSMSIAAFVHTSGYTSLPPKAVCGRIAAERKRFSSRTPWIPPISSIMRSWMARISAAEIYSILFFREALKESAVTLDKCIGPGDELRIDLVALCVGRFYRNALALRRSGHADLVAYVQAHIF